jgi:hypothetical protein
VFLLEKNNTKFVDYKRTKKERRNFINIDVVNDHSVFVLVISSLSRAVGDCFDQNEKKASVLFSYEVKVTFGSVRISERKKNISDFGLESANTFYHQYRINCFFEITDIQRIDQTIVSGYG